MRNIKLTVTFMHGTTYYKHCMNDIARSEIMNKWREDGINITIQSSPTRIVVHYPYHSILNIREEGTN